MVCITKKVEFCASHRYWNPAWSEEENYGVFGRSSFPHGHGHNYVIEVTVCGPLDKQTGMVMNLRLLKEILEEVIEELDHKNLNEDIPYFQEKIPTTENLAVYLWERIRARLLEVDLSLLLKRVRVHEDSTLSAEYPAQEADDSRPVAESAVCAGKTSVLLTRAYRFASAHRLHNPALTAEENARIYQKCNSSHGHGHEYTLEVTVAGAPDSETGMVARIDALDRAVHEEILSRYDHRHLDREVPDFQERASTGEHIIQTIWDRLHGKIPGAELHHLRLHETRKNAFDYSGEITDSWQREGTPRRDA